MKRVMATVGLLGAAVLFVAGCAAAPQSNARASVVLPDELPRVTSASVLPFEEYQLGRSERQRMQLGQAELLGSCLASFGITATFAGDYIEQVSADPDFPIVYQWGGRLGTLTSAQASEYGYAAPPGQPWQPGGGFYLLNPGYLYVVPSADPVESARIAGVLYGPDQAVVTDSGDTETRVSPEQLPTNVQGDPPANGGCFRAVEGEIHAPLVDLSEEESRAFDLTFEDDAVEQAIGRWAECMRKSDYGYTRIDEGAGTNGGPVTRQTRAAAMADVRCTGESRWPDVFYFVLAYHQRQAVELQPQLFESALAAETARAETIDRLLG